MMPHVLYYILPLALFPNLTKCDAIPTTTVIQKNNDLVDTVNDHMEPNVSNILSKFELSYITYKRLYSKIKTGRIIQTVQKDFNSYVKLPVCSNQRLWLSWHLPNYVLFSMLTDSDLKMKCPAIKIISYPHCSSFNLKILSTKYTMEKSLFDRHLHLVNTSSNT